MRKRLILWTAVLTAAALLTACGRTEQSTSATGAGTGSTTSAEGSGPASANQGGSPDTTLAGGTSGTSSGTTSAAGEDPVVTVITDGGQSSDTGSQSGDTGTQNGSSTTAQTDSAAAGTDTADAGSAEQTQENITVEPTYDELNQSGGDTTGEEADQTYDVINQSGGEQSMFDWSGVYDRDDGEELTIGSPSNDSFFFSFALCQISGTAVIDSADPSTAVYSGDDDNNILFTIGDDTITVTVTNLNGDDTSEAAMTGIYELSDDDE